MGVSKESISKFLIGNQFHVKLRILSPENCKQSLQVKSWKAEVTAEKKQTQDYNRNFVIQAHKWFMSLYYEISIVVLSLFKWFMSYDLWACITKFRL